MFSILLFYSTVFFHFTEQNKWWWWWYHDILAWKYHDTIQLATSNPELMNSSTSRCGPEPTAWSSTGLRQLKSFSLTADVSYSHAVHLNYRIFVALRQFECLVSHSQITWLWVITSVASSVGRCAEWAVMRLRLFTSRWCSSSSSTLLPPDSCLKTCISLHKLILPSYCTLLYFVNFSLKIWWMMDGL